MAISTWQSHRQTDRKEYLMARKLFRDTKHKLPPTAKFISSNVDVLSESIIVYWRSDRKQGRVYGNPQRDIQVNILPTGLRY